MVSAARIQQQLTEAAALLQHGNALRAQRLLRDVLTRAPNDPGALHLAGHVSKALGDATQATEYFRLSLAAAPNQPEVLNNLGNLLLAQGDTDNAESCYRQCLKLAPGLQACWKNLGLALLQKEQPAPALEALQKAVSLKPDDISALNARGDALKELERYDEAIAAYRQVLAIKPDYINALHNLALAYKLAEKPEEALPWYARAALLAPGVAQIDYNHGNALFELGRFDEAEQAYLSALRKSPDHVEVHQTLNALYWQLGRYDDFGASFRRAIAQIPDNLPLRHAYARSLELAGRQEQALQVIEQAPAAFQQQPEWLQLKARLLANRDDLDAAAEAFSRALTAGADSDVRLDFAALNIRRGDYAMALQLLADVERARPDDQLMWAYRGLCWRLMGDERHGWLNDVNAYVREYELAVPAGYNTLAAFLDDLTRVLEAMHRTRSSPLDQTLIHGTQTPGRLFHKPVREIGLLKAGLGDAVSQYIAALPRDDSHPLLRRNTGHYRFSGSWSVKLTPGGYHFNHVHPQGWISSSFYVALPASTRTQDGNPHAGCIQFGQSSLQLGDREAIAATIRPAAGKLVLFPSYTWHGTVPFEGDHGDFRLTAPFDAVPA